MNSKGMISVTNGQSLVAIGIELWNRDLLIHYKSIAEFWCSPATVANDPKFHTIRSHGSPCPPVGQDAPFWQSWYLLYRYRRPQP